MNEWSIAPLLVWAAFILVTSVGGLFAEGGGGSKKLLGFYALMLVGVGVGALFGWVESLLANRMWGICVGIIVGGAVGGIAGAVSCGLLTDDNHIVTTPVILFGAAVGAIVGMFAGILAGAQDYSSLFWYLPLLLAVEVISFVIAQIIRFVRSFGETVKIMNDMARYS